MKQTIKIKLFDKACMPKRIKGGDWFDLRAAEDIQVLCPFCTDKAKNKSTSTRKVVSQTTLIFLGVAMKLPKGMEAIVVARSSSNKNFNIMQTNGFGVIDSTYCGPNDQWFIPIISTGEVNIKKGDRICQFRIQPTQSATFWQKLKWLLSSGVEFKVVDELYGNNRGGYGHSGIK